MIILLSVEDIQNFNNILKSFKIKAACVNFKKEDNYFFYDVKLNSSAKVKDIKKYSDEISLALKTPGKPSIKVLHNQGVVRLEFISPRRSRLNLFDYFTNKNIPEGELPCLLGQAVDGQKIWMDLAQNPHMIVSGTTGSGKSVLLHNIIANLFNYTDAKLFLLDPKNIEFIEYHKNIKNNLQVGFSYNEAIDILDYLLDTMELRYEILRDNKADDMPFIVLIIDEFADLIMQDLDNQFYDKLCKLAQKCRAAKIHIILSTQRPSANVINGTIKANFPARLACRVSSHVDSKVILDAVGAENLLGNGDALIRDNFRFMERFQVAFTSPKEVCNYFGSHP